MDMREKITYHRLLLTLPIRDFFRPVRYIPINPLYLWSTKYLIRSYTSSTLVISDESNTDSQSHWFNGCVASRLSLRKPFVSNHRFELQPIYSTLFKRNSIFVTTVFLSAFSFSIGFDLATTAYWDYHNKGVSIFVFSVFSSVGDRVELVSLWFGHSSWQSETMEGYPCEVHRSRWRVGCGGLVI